jgi:hypothetical protein
MVNDAVVRPDAFEAVTVYVDVTGGGGMMVEGIAAAVPLTTPALLMLRPLGRGGYTL